VSKSFECNLLHNSCFFNFFVRMNDFQNVTTDLIQFEIGFVIYGDLTY
jgi:hypothetical protein